MTKHSKKKLPTWTGWRKRGKNLNAIQLMEKQKAKYSYGILEKQRFIQKHQLKVTGEVFTIM
jgi:hypothetical protein